MFAWVSVVRAVAPRPHLARPGQQVKPGYGHIVGNFGGQFTVQQRGGAAELGGDGIEYPVPFLFSELPYPDAGVVWLVCADVQRDDGGVVGGEDAGVGKGPAGGVPAGPWCAWWRRGGQSAVTSAAAVRALDSSTMALRLA